MSRVLYLSYDGMTDPLGGSQVLPYLEGLAARGHAITLISFEKPERLEGRAEVAAQCGAAGIDWRPLPYTRTPPVLSTVHDLAAMSRLAERLSAARPFDTVHCRSTLPALVGARLKRRYGTRFLFDMRGFWADERVEGGLWDLGSPLFRIIYRWFKRQEARLLREADHVVVLTEAGRDVLRERFGLGDQRRVSVIPCCTDFAAFPPVTAERRREARALLGIAGDVPVAAYLGSIGTWYMLPEMLDCFAVQRQREPGSVMLFVTRDDAAPILAAAAARGISQTALRIRAASRAEVPLFLAAADYGLFFIRPTFSKRGSSPVKLGELLALELPMLTNAGVGDVDRILAESGAGVTVPALDQFGYSAGLDRLAALRPDMGRWRETRGRWFDLDRGVACYAAIYAELGPAMSRNS